MRLIFISLVVANLSVAIWGVFFSDGDSVSGSGPVATTSKSAPVSDKPSADLPGGADDFASAGTAGRSLCELVGAFESDNAAESFVQRLASIDIVSEVKRIELPAGVSYWIHLPPEDSREAAFRRLGEMQSQGIESYVIGKGELANSVSLGVFTVEGIADAHFNNLKKMGLDAQKSVFERMDLELWVEISPVEARKMSELTWSRMLEGLTGQERRQNFCLPVAS